MLHISHVVVSYATLDNILGLPPGTRVVSAREMPDGLGVALRIASPVNPTTHVMEEGEPLSHIGLAFREAEEEECHRST